MQEDLADHVDRRWLIFFREGLPMPKPEAIHRYMSILAELVFQDPEEAVFFADLIPALTPYLEKENRARAYGLAASAYTVGRKLDHAELMLQEAMSLANDRLAQADLYSRKVSLAFASEAWDEYREYLTIGRNLAEQCEQNASEIRSRLEVQAAVFAREVDRDHQSAIRLCMNALREPSCAPHTRKSALANLVASMRTLSPRMALRILDAFYQWRRLPNAGFCDYVLAWVDGHARARVATSHNERRAARKRLCWVAEGLHRLGYEADAVMATLDLVTLAYDHRVQGQAAKIAADVIGSILTHPNASSELRRRAEQYLADPAHPIAVQLRAIFVELYEEGVLGREAPSVRMMSR